MDEIKMLNEMEYSENGKGYKVLAYGVYKNRPFLAMNISGWHPTAYIAFHDQEVDEKLIDGLPVHGGVTWGGGFAECGRLPSWIADKDTKKILHSLNALCERTGNDCWLGWGYSGPSDFIVFSSGGKGKKWTTAEIVEEIKTAVDYAERKKS